MEAEFETAVAVVLTNEGDFQINTNDPGNWTGGVVGEGELRGTNMGISAAQYPDEDIKGMTAQRAKYIYYVDYWKRYQVDKIHVPALQEKLFDMLVVMGDNSAVRCLQRACRASGKTVLEDGQMGIETLTTANNCDTMLIVPFRSECAAHFRLVAQRKNSSAIFLEGWLRRAYS